MKTNFWKTVILLLLAFGVGAAVMHWWDGRRSTCALTNVAEGEDSASVWLLDMQQAQAPQDVQEVKTDDTPQEITVPSQLSKIELADVEKIITRSGAEFSAPENDTPAPESTVDLQNVSYTRVIPVKAVKEGEASESKISMIEAPVNAKLINSLEENREFKRQARGSYPEADFNKQQVLVLESASNLPDKAFEIVAVEEQDGKRQVVYRINVFGLDKKVNTHSVALIDKKDLPLELKQVL